MMHGPINIKYFVHLSEMFTTLERGGFTLKREKVHLAQEQIKFRGRSLSLSVCGRH